MGDSFPAGRFQLAGTIGAGSCFDIRNQGNDLCEEPLFEVLLPIKRKKDKMNKGPTGEGTMMGKHIQTFSNAPLTKTVMTGGCGECQTSCQSACKTSCTVSNQSCQK